MDKILPTSGFFSDGKEQDPFEKDSSVLDSYVQFADSYIAEKQKNPILDSSSEEEEEEEEEEEYRSKVKEEKEIQIKEKIKNKELGIIDPVEEMIHKKEGLIKSLMITSKEEINCDSGSELFSSLGNRAKSSTIDDLSCEDEDEMDAMKVIAESLKNQERNRYEDSYFQQKHRERIKRLRSTKSAHLPPLKLSITKGDDDDEETLEDNKRSTIRKEDEEERLGRSFKGNRNRINEDEEERLGRSFKGNRKRVNEDEEERLGRSFNNETKYQSRSEIIRKNNDIRDSLFRPKKRLPKQKPKRPSSPPSRPTRSRSPTKRPRFHVKNVSSDNNVFNQRKNMKKREKNFTRREKNFREFQKRRKKPPIPQKVERNKFIERSRSAGRLSRRAQTMMPIRAPLGSPPPGIPRSKRSSDKRSLKSPPRRMHGRSESPTKVRRHRRTKSPPPRPIRKRANIYYKKDSRYNFQY